MVTHYYLAKLPITSLAPLISTEGKTASHFLWLVSDDAIQNPERFLAEVPTLLDFIKHNYPSYLSSFASWWHYCGVPEVNEAKAIDYLFKWLLSAEITTSIKSRALWVLVALTKKYPELKGELKHCWCDQMDKNSNDFNKRPRKIAAELEE